MEIYLTENVNLLFSQMGNIEVSLEKMKHKEDDGRANMGLVWGDSGWGKTKALELYAKSKKDKCILIRSRRTWTASWLIEDTARALGVATNGRTRDRHKRVCEYLDVHKMILIYDEMNHFVDDVKIMETLRDFHDICGNNPIIIAGSEGLEEKIKRYHSLIDRLRINIGFRGVTGEDVGLFASKKETNITKEVQDEISKDSKSMRNMLSILENIDDKAKANGIEMVDLKTYKRLRK